MKAAVFVDVQNDFIDGALKNDKAIEVTPKIVTFAQECLAKGYALYATRDTHEKTKYSCYETGYGENDKLTEKTKTVFPTSGYLTTLEGKKLPVEHCIYGTNGWQINSELMNVLKGNCTFIQKNTFGSFDIADVIEEDFEKKDELDPNSLDEIILCGFCTSICVLANAVILRAKFPNVKITVMKDLCACVTEESHNAALKCLEMQQIDVV